MNEIDALTFILSVFSHASTTGGLKIKEARFWTLTEALCISKRSFFLLQPEESDNLKEKEIDEFSECAILTPR